VKRPSHKKLIALARELAPANPRAAFDLAHRARRLLELAAETASRNRWDRLETPRERLTQPDAIFAAECANAVIRYPVAGEAAVYAALLDAVDVAHAVSDMLYQDWLATQRTDEPLPLPPRGVNRLGGPMAAGCSRAVPAGSSDDEISSMGC